MAFDPVAWFVEGGRHSANVARVVAHAAFGGQPGIVGPKDLEVRELSVPGSAVRIFPGTAAIANFYTDGEMYAGRNPIETQVDIAATGASARSDMIVARVVNPYVEAFPPGWPPLDDDQELGPFFAPYVISGVPATAKTLMDAGEPDMSAIPLARIDMPPSTSTVAQAYITDLRSMSAVFHARENYVHRLGPGETDFLTETTFVRFPNFNTSEFDVEVPRWATHAHITAEVAGCYLGATPADARALFAIEVSHEGDILEWSLGTEFDFSYYDGLDLSEQWRFALPGNVRGQTVKVKPIAKITYNQGNDPQASAMRSSVRINVDFECRPENNL